MLIDQKGGDLSFSPPGVDTARTDMFTPVFNRFFDTHQQVMWQYSALDFTTMRPELLEPVEVEALRGAMLVESHNPVYTARILDYYRHDHEMTSFTITWGYEEMKHYLVLRKYLEATGLVDNQELAQERAVTRAGPWGDREVGYTRVQAFTEAMMQEQITAQFYKRFRARTKEPLLKEILELISGDEYRHCQFYLDKGKQELAEDKHRMDEVDEALLDFEFPGPTFIQDETGHYSKAVREVTGMDAKAYKETMDKLAVLIGRGHLLKLAMDRRFQRKFANEWGGSLLKAVGIG